MEVTVHDAETATEHGPLTIAIPTSGGIVLMTRDSSTDATQSRSDVITSCPAYRICRQLKESRRSPDDHRDQQVLRDLLQPLKETALKLRQLIPKDVKEQRNLHSGTLDRGSRPNKRSDQLSSISVCALCGVALHLRDPSAKPRQEFDGSKRIDDYLDYDITLKSSDNTLLGMTPHKVTPPPSVKISKNSDSFNEVDTSARENKKRTSNVQLVDMSEELRSKLVFVKRNDDLSDKTTCQICQHKSQRKYDRGTQATCADDNSYARKIVSERSRRYNVNKASKPVKLMQQSLRMTRAPPTIPSIKDASTLTHEIFCPCACGLLATDETESEISIESLPMLRQKLIKTKLKELGFYPDSQEASAKMDDDIRKSDKTEAQKLEKNKSIERWIQEELMQMQLQTQAKKLHSNIRFFKEENKKLRRLVEKCRCTSEKMEVFTATYQRLTTVIELLRAKYRDKNGIIATITDTFQDSINIQRITDKLFAPFANYWNRRSLNRISSTHMPSVSKMEQPFLEPTRSVILMLPAREDKMLETVLKHPLGEDIRSRLN